MIYHIVSSSLYIDRFIRFIRKNQEQITGKHCFVFSTPKTYEHYNDADCKYAQGLLSLLKIFLLAGKGDRFILHSYMHPWVYLVCFLTFWNLKKITWVIWGGDLYFYREKKTVKYKCYEFLRKHTIKYFGYISGVEGDYALAKKYYHVKGRLLQCIYPLDMDLTLSIPVKDKMPEEPINILIGNSADMSNNHEEALEILKNFKECNIKLYVPLSYGGNHSYIESVKQQGERLFGEKFVAITNYLTHEEYNEFLAQMDIMVCNHDRQQALGNLYALINLGKKVFIREDITTADLFNKYGIKFFITQNIVDMSIEELMEYSQDDRLKNKNILSHLYSERNMVLVWNNLFESNH